MRFYKNTKKAKSKSKSKKKSKNTSASFSSETKNRIASFTRKKDIKNKKRVFKTIQNELEDNKCAICLEYMKHTQSTTKTNCEHKFHTACLEDWKKKSNNCPLCRKNISDTLALDLDPAALAEQQRIRDETETALDAAIGAARQQGRDSALVSINLMRSNYVRALQGLESLDNSQIADAWRRVTTSAYQAASIAAERARRHQWTAEAAVDVFEDNEEEAPVAEVVASASATQAYFMYQQYLRVLQQDVRETAAAGEENTWLEMLTGGPRTRQAVRESAMRMADPYRWMGSTQRRIAARGRQR